MAKQQKKVESELMVSTAIHYLGVDVSKDKLDIYYEVQDKGTHRVIANEKEEIGIFVATLLSKYPSIGFRFVLEPTGTYSDVLMHSLYRLGIPFSMVSPEKSRSFMRSENLTSITDKQSAKMLHLWGKQKTPQAYQMPTEAEMHLKQLLSALDDLKKDLRRIENQKHAQSQLVNCNAIISSIWDQKVTETKKHIQTLEKQITDLAQANFQEMIKNIQSIKSVGNATATAIVILTQGLSGCDSAKSLAKFIGLCPTQGNSGTSVKKPKHIPRAGNNTLKSLLFNCARSALLCNPKLKELYDRLVIKGKNGKVALTAVMHKLVRIIYGVAKSGRKYDANFSLAKNI